MKYFITIFLIILSISVFSQKRHHSVHKEQNDLYKNKRITTEKGWDLFHNRKVLSKNETSHFSTNTNNSCNLERIVFGWHPYWVGSAYLDYDWNLMTDFSFFSYEVNAATGQPNSTHGWATSAAVDAALANNVRVNLCVTLFSDHTTFFASASAKQTLITNLINAVQSRGAHGVNIDFEGVPSSQKQNYTDWLIDLSNQIKAVNPSYQISIATYSVDWNDLFDVVVLRDYIDYFCIMGYGYYWSGSSYAGPTDPLYTYITGYNYSLSRTLTYYLDKGVPNNQLVLGLPYYGREWSTTSGAIPSSTTGSGSAKFFNSVSDNSSGNYSNRLWDDNSFTPYYSFQSGGAWKQCFIMDGPSLENRLDLINRRDIAGMAIWALGYDDGYSDLWNAIENKFTDCEIVECNGTIYDMGGPNRDYYNDENYTYTISPTGASIVTLEFTSFDVEAGYDSLFIYDGTSSSAPLIGAYSGNNSPGTITASGSSITIRFTSDGATTRSGWVAHWSCSDYPNPTTNIFGIPNPCESDFQCHFTDLYNIDIQLLDRTFLQVCDNNGTEWRSNQNNGYLNENFETNIHPDWTNYSGNWSISAGSLFNSDETINNTIFSTPLNQNEVDEYLYHWNSSIGGTGINKRAGLHFMCDNPQLPNRGNSYFVYYRIDSDKLQLYEVNDDTYSLVSNVDYVFEPSTNYDFKVTFNKVSGQMDVFINDNFVTTWTDATPLNSGDYVSFRSGHCTYTIDDFRVYKLRNSSQLITVSPDHNSDIRYESPRSSPSESGMIRSIVIDSNKKLSNIDEEKFDVNHTIIQPLLRNSNDNVLFSLNVYPNPSQDLFNISILVNENGMLKIYNGKGQLIFNKTIQANTSITNISLEESISWHQGIYFVQLISGERIISKKIIKE